MNRNIYKNDSTADKFFAGRDKFLLLFSITAINVRLLHLYMSYLNVAIKILVKLRQLIEGATTISKLGQLPKKKTYRRKLLIISYKFALS